MGRGHAFLPETPPTARREPKANPTTSAILDAANPYMASDDTLSTNLICGCNFIFKSSNPIQNMGIISIQNLEINKLWHHTYHLILHLYSHNRRLKKPALNMIFGVTNSDCLAHYYTNCYPNINIWQFLVHFCGIKHFCIALLMWVTIWSSMLR